MWEWSYNDEVGLGSVEISDSDCKHLLKVLLLGSFPLDEYCEVLQQNILYQWAREIYEEAFDAEVSEEPVELREVVRLVDPGQVTFFNVRDLSR